MREVMNSNQKVYSFDVFDTCISRTYEKPSDLFYHLGLMIAPENTSTEKAHIFANSFLITRIDAEIKANRMHGKKRSCHIHEIYSLLTLHPQCTHSKFEIMRLELKLEEQSLYAIQSTREIIDKLRASNKRIIFISDMYLDASFVKRQLIKHGFYEDGDGLYVSSESTLIKRTGMLFKLVLQNENIHAQELFHIGDNLACDIRPANRLGIQTAHIQNTHIPFHEAVFSDSKLTPVERRINSISKYIRLSNPNTYTETELKLFSIISPAIISFTLWSLQTALNMGLNRVYFVSRNGELPYKIAKLFESYFPQIEVKFLYGSRKAWLLPSISPQSSDWKYAMPKKSTSSIREVLERLSLEAEDISDIDSIANTKGLSVDEIEKSNITLINIIDLLEDYKINEIIYSKINNARELTIEYLQQEGLLSDNQWAIVDSGWELNCQAHLNRLVKSISPHNEAKGLYFGMVPSHLPNDITGPAASFTDKLSIFSQRGYVVENCFLFSALQSTCGYIRNYEKIIPEYSKLSPNNFELDYGNKIYSFIEEYKKQLDHIKIPISIFIEHKSELIEKLAHLISKPDTAIAQHLTNLKINEDFKHTDSNSYPLCKGLTTADLANQVMGFFYSKIKRKQIWLEASICLSNPVIGLLFRSLIYLNRIRYIISNLKIKQSS